MSAMSAMPRQTSFAPPAVPLAIAVALVATLPVATLAQGGDPCAPIAAEIDEILIADGSFTAPDVALFGNGEGIVVLEGSSEESDNDRLAVLGVFIDDSGMPDGDVFQVNTSIQEDQFNAAVAAAPDGRFVVVWESDVSPGDPDGSSIRGRLYGANGLPRGSDFQVNDFVLGNQTVPQVGMADDGSFVVAWTSEKSPGDDDDSTSIQARRFDANGNPRGPQFQVNTASNFIQNEADVGVAPDGRFVVVFSSFPTGAGTDGDSFSIQMRRYSADGQAQGAAQQVNVVTQSFQDQPKVAVDADGTYLVVWRSDGSAGSDDQRWSMQARGFLTSGVAAGNQFQVNERIPGDQDSPHVAAVGGREFLVAWEHPVQGVTYPEAAGRAVTLEGKLLGFEFTVAPSIAWVAVGGNRQSSSVIVAGTFGRAGNDDNGIVGQAYSHPCATGDGVTECTESATTLCLNRDRFRVTLAWRTAEGEQGAGQAVELTLDTGYFTIFDAANVEVVIKVLDACGFNQRYWAFVAGLTDLEIDLIVEDTLTATVQRYANPAGTPFQPVNDTNAFSTCP
jgi:hypothetical protein